MYHRNSKQHQNGPLLKTVPISLTAFPRSSVIFSCF